MMDLLDYPLDKFVSDAVAAAGGVCPRPGELYQAARADGIDCTEAEVRRRLAGLWARYKLKLRPSQTLAGLVMGKGED